MKNTWIREEIRKKQIPQWQVAERIGVSEYTLCKWLRYDLPEDKKAKIRAAIKQIEERRSEA